MAVYQFYAELEDYKPKMWRRFLVDSDITIARIGYTVMAMYEMEASHLLVIEHERTLLTPSGRRSKRTERIDRYSIPDEDDDFFRDMDEDATKTKLSDLDLSNPHRLLVWYDMGDDWRVIVTLEEVLASSPEHELPHVIKGKGFGIVEDCGGVYGLGELAEAFKTKQGDEYERFKEWLGVDDLDLSAFDIDDINLRVKKLPDIYAKIYEGNHMPTDGEIEFIERGYIKR